jgi:glycosidase
VFYEVFVRSFADSTTGPLANDGIGDLQGLIERLDYLNDGDPDTSTDLGVTGIWLMPVAQSPSYHGYDVTDYYTIEEDYGTNEDFKRLIEEAHKRGIRVIVDLVLNHTSSEHPWFRQAPDKNSPYHDWYIWSDENPGYKGPWGQTVWHRLGNQWYYGIFWEGMPDLNYNNPAVTDEMLKVSDFWLTEMGVDGFRLDAIRHLYEEAQLQENAPQTFTWLGDFHDHYKAVKPDAFAVGEVWTNTETAAKYVGRKVDAVFEFDLAESILSSINNRNRSALATALNTAQESFPSGQYAPFLTNHDQDRVMSQLARKTDRAKLAATILLTLPGVPFIYYGEEIGMTGQKPDEKIRTPMQWTGGPHAGFSAVRPWEPVNQGYEDANIEAQSADPDSLLSLYRELISLRNQHPALRSGAWFPVEADNRRVYAFMRQSPDETLLALFNLNDKPESEYALNLTEGSIPATKTASELLHETPVSAPQLDGNGQFSDYRPIATLQPRTGYIIRLVP